MFSYGEAETILAGLHGASPERQTGAFRAHLKTLKKLGVPLGINPGRGKKIKYAREHLYQWAFCLECAEFGLDPTWVAENVERHWAWIYKNVFVGAENHDLSGNDDIFMFLLPGLLSAAALDPDGNLMNRAIPNWGYLSLSRLREDIGAMGRVNRRVCLFNVSAIIRPVQKAETYLEALSEGVSPSNLATVVRDAVEFEKYGEERGVYVPANPYRPARSGFMPTKPDAPDPAPDEA